MLELYLALVSIALFLALVFLIRKVFQLRQAIEELRFQKTSQSVKYGKLTEQFIPFVEGFPFNPEKFRFLGNPIDGIVFDEEEIVFCEFKTASSSLNQNQKRVRQLVKEKAVKWLEFRIG